MKKPYYHAVTIIVRNWSDEEMDAWSSVDELIKGITEDAAYRAEADNAEIRMASSLPLPREKGGVFFTRRAEPH